MDLHCDLHGFTLRFTGFIRGYPLSLILLRTGVYYKFLKGHTLSFVIVGNYHSIDALYIHIYNAF